MAATTLKAIIDRWQAVLEAAPLFLQKTAHEFSHDRQPNELIAGSYRIEDGGLVQQESGTNNVSFRVDRLTVWVARKHNFASNVERETLETDLNTIERYLIADGPANNYHVWLEDRTVSHPDASDVMIGSLTCTVDYDFSISTS